MFVKERERERERILKIKRTLSKTGLKSLLGEAEGGGWRRRGQIRHLGHLHQTTATGEREILILCV